MERAFYSLRRGSVVRPPPRRKLLIPPTEFYAPTAVGVPYLST